MIAVFPKVHHTDTQAHGNEQNDNNNNNSRIGDSVWHRFLFLSVKPGPPSRQQTLSPL
jgi:hypothetical protein